VLAMRGWMRWNRDTPLGSSTAISPSSTACEAAMWCGITASSGYWRSQRKPLRDCRRTSSLSTKARARTPSHFTSKSQPSPRGTRSASIAVIGSIAAGIPASCAPLRTARRRFDMARALVPAASALMPTPAFDTAGTRACATSAGGSSRAGRRTVGRARRLTFGLARRQVARDLFLGAAGEHAVGERLHVPAGGGKLVAPLDEQPLVAFFRALHPNDGEIAVQLFAVQAELQIATRQLGIGGDVAQQVERAPVPQHHAAPAVIAGRNIAFEIAVLQGVVFHVRREHLHRGIERWPLGYGPGFQDAIDLQAKVVVEAGGIVPLHTKRGF